MIVYSTTTGDAPQFEDGLDEPHCFVCGRHTEHVAEHDDLVEAGQAVYADNGSVLWA